MLNQLSLDARFRSLTPDTFSSSHKFGQRTIIYGHNGSGKSSLAELLHQISNGKQNIPVTWSDEANRKTKLKPNTHIPNVMISSFCKSWIKENVLDFLDGSSAAAIVALGKTARDAQQNETILKGEIDELEEQKPKIEDELKEAEGATQAIIKGVQDAIEGTLRDVDHRWFTKSRFNGPKVRELLSQSSDKYADEAQHRQNLDMLHVEKLDQLGITICPTPEWSELGQKITELLEKDIQSKVINEILGNVPLQHWLEEGLALHDKKHNCLFCEHPLPHERLNTLKLHFDKSRKNVQLEVEALQRVIMATKMEVENWWQNTPNEKDLYSELHEDFRVALEKEEPRVNAILDILNEMYDALVEKYNAPEQTSFGINFMTSVTAGEFLKGIFIRHNTLTEKAEERKKEAADEVLKFLIGSNSKSYKQLKKSADAKRAEYTQLCSDLDLKKQQWNDERAKQFSSKEIADRISRDLEIVYGRHHLSIEVSPDGMNYRCMRDGSPAKNLSEGERNTLALTYFLRHLEDEEKNIDPKHRLIVVDDPSSSLDR